MRTNYVPAIIMLLAGLVDCIMSIYYKLDLFSFTKRLLLVLVIFYILGIVIKIVIDKNMNVMEDTEAEDIISEDIEEDMIENIDTNQDYIDDTEE